MGSHPPTSLARVHQARQQFLRVELRAAKARLEWAEAVTSDSEGMRLQARDLLRAWWMIVDGALVQALDELAEAQREAQAAGLL